jgi:hypothetical protein
VERLLDNLSRLRLDPHRPTLGYRFGLMLVALLMVSLPLAYFTAVGALCWGLITVLLSPPIGGHFVLWIGYGAVAALGPLCVFFLVKPWFTRRTVEHESVPLKPGEAPDLECFVGLLARAVGAPGPRQIELDCSVNASASFAGGWRGVWRQELKLTLGMPLIAGLDLRSFAGVLAHELGHFSQRGGMRLAWFVMLVNEWFSRLVHGRDRWDQRLAAGARSERIIIKGFALSALALVWLSRQPLRLLMATAKLVSSFALRQMEFDADGYEIVFAGSEAFRRTSREINLLNVGSAKALRLIGEALPEGSLPRNLPALARKQTESLSDRVRAAVEEEMMATSARFALFKGSPRDERSPTFFSTHPCDRERIEIAESHGAPGLVHNREPAASLFFDFEDSAEKITETFYDTHFTAELEACRLVDNARFVGTVRDREDHFEACEQFFGGRFTVARPLLFSKPDIKDVLRGRYQDDVSIAPQIAGWLRDGAQIFDQFETAEDDLVDIARATELFQAGFRIRRKTFGLPRGLAALSDHHASAAARRDRALVKLAEFDQLARRCLLGVASEKLQRGSRAEQQQTRRVLRALASMGLQFPNLLKLRRCVLAQRALLQNVTSISMGRTIVDRLQRNSTELSEMCTRIRGELERVRYPFDHAAGKISIADYAHPNSRESPAIVGSFRSAETLLERLFDLYFRLVGHLCPPLEE